MFSRYATKKQVETALEHGFAALEQYRKDIVAEGEEIVRQARDAGKQIIVLAGRPYHIDPEINHGINDLITSFGFILVTEDAVAYLEDKAPRHVLQPVDLPRPACITRPGMCAPRRTWSSFS